MFLGYQNGKIAFLAETREELESLPCVTLDRIEEAPFAETFNGVVYTDKKELFQVKTKAVEETRASLYAKEVDTITAHIQRLKDEEQTEEIKAEIETLIAERAAKVAEIKERLPYPVEETAEAGVQ